MTEPESMKRVRNEFAKLSGVSEAKDIRSALKELNLENCYDQTFLGYVMSEALRLSPPAALTTMMAFEKDTKLGSKLIVKAGESILVNMVGLHKNTT